MNTEEVRRLLIERVESVTEVNPDPGNTAKLGILTFFVGDVPPEHVGDVVNRVSEMLGSSAGEVDGVKITWLALPVREGPTKVEIFCLRKD